MFISFEDKRDKKILKIILITMIITLKTKQVIEFTFQRNVY